MCPGPSAVFSDGLSQETAQLSDAPWERRAWLESPDLHAGRQHVFKLCFGKKINDDLGF